MDLWVARWLGFGPLGGKMLAISVRKFVEFRRTSDLKLVGLKLLECSWGASLDLLDPGGRSGPPYVGVTTVGPKDILVLGPNLNKIQKVLTGQNSCID